MAGFDSINAINPFIKEGNVAAISSAKTINPSEKVAVTGAKKGQIPYFGGNSEKFSIENIAKNWNGNPKNDGFGFYSSTLGIVGKKLDIQGV